MTASSPFNAVDVRAVHTLLTPLRPLLAARAGEAGGGLTMDTVGRFDHDDREHEIVRLTFKGPDAGRDYIRLGLFAGIHGDEPAGCAALVRLSGALAAVPARGAGYELSIYPVINPTGYESGTRKNYAGKDLNREFWRQSSSPEVRAIETELRAHQFDGIITLHADDTCEGIYGYAHGRTLNESLLKPALRAASRFLPLDERALIDGFAACDGLIHDCFESVLSAPPEQRPRPFDLIVETPAHASFDLQVSAAVAAVETIVAIYPGFISYAQDL